MDAVLAVRFGPFWGQERSRCGGAFMVVGTLPLPRSWGTNNSGLLARSLCCTYRGTFPELGNHVHIRGSGVPGIGMRF